MKKNRVTIIVHLLIITLFLSASQSFAAKPLPVIEMSNGYPSGAHFNLNLHGKDASNFQCETVEGGNSVFINEYGVSSIEYLTNRKSTVTELKVLDPCADAFDNTPAKVQLPYEEQGYYVFATIKGKPNNGTNDEPSSIILSPNLVRNLCNDTSLSNPEFPDYTQCPDDQLLVLGLIAGNNLYEATDVGFIRFDEPETTKGKGKSKAKDITQLFMWTGWVYDATIDISGPNGIPDGTIDVYDVPLDYDGDGDIDTEDFILWQQDQQVAGLASFYENEWIFNVADLVVTEQDITNDGTKLLKIRFYPKDTTQFTGSN